jgi:hypothetical protein
MHIAAITDNEYREFGGLILSENGNPEMAVFGTTELFVILLIHRLCCCSELSLSRGVHLQTGALQSGTSGQNSCFQSICGMTLLKLHLRFRTIVLLMSKHV